MGTRTKAVSVAVCLVLFGVMLAGCVGEPPKESEVRVPQELTVAVVKDHGGHKDFGVWRSHIFETLVGASPG